MSGIVGMVNLDGAPVDRELLGRMTERMAFRGPDAQETWVDGPVGFGHTLLRTTYEAAGETQPCSLDGRVWITADARIDGRGELIRELESEGCGDLGNLPDVELVLHAYKVWGLDCVDHLIGDFTFAIWDSVEKRLFCARDHFGIRPFFYAHVGACLVFGNSINAIRLHPAVSDQVNDRAIVQYLVLRYQVELDSTAFADIRRLPPAHLLTWSRGGAPATRRYWTLPIEEPLHFKRSADCVEQFRDLLDTAVSDRLRTDRAHFSLSGGMDSSSVAACAAAARDHVDPGLELSASTFGYDRLIPDEEMGFARLVADHLGIDHRCISIDDSRYLDGYDLEEPPPEPGYSSWFPSLEREFSESFESRNVRVCLGGNGADSLFSGEPLMDLILKGKVWNAISEGGGYFLARRRLPSIGFRTTLRRWRDKGKQDDSEVDEQVLALIRPELLEELGHGTIAWPQLADAERHPWRPNSYKHLTDGFWTVMLESFDTIKRPPVEWRFPFLDLRLVRFMLRVSPHRWAPRKEVLREAMRGRLPEAVRVRKKTPLASEGRHDYADWVSSGPSVMPVLAKYVAADEASKEFTMAVGTYSGVRLLLVGHWLRWISENPKGI